jgi:phosphonoacetaldehyde methylase
MVNTLTEELLTKMIDSGLYQVTLSLDSGNAKTLKEHHRKPVNLQRVPDLAKYLKARGILMHATLVVGMPGETIEDIDEGYRYVESLPLDSIGVFIAQALPGSELYETALAAGLIDRATARIIDTAQSNISLSGIPRETLEKNVEEFLLRYNAEIKRRDPASWEKKYKRHRDRLAKICIGRAAPNTQGVIRASQPAPMENFSY